MSNNASATPSAGKGDARRPSQVTREIRDKNYDGINWNSKKKSDDKKKD